MTGSLTPLPHSGKPLQRDVARTPTQAETALWTMLRDCRPQGMSFRRQAPVGPFILDFFCASARMAVEVDGGIHDTPNAVRRDQERTEILEQAYGITVLRVRNEDVLLQPRKTLQRITDAVHAGKAPHPVVQTS